jgi:hypothetical protein
MPSAAKHGGGRENNAKTRPRIIYFNIGWMIHYAGLDDADPTLGGHGFLRENRHGAEAYNFVPTKSGALLGYRPPGSRDQTNINRLGATPQDAFVDDILVVWMAREPGTSRTLIVGWYQNARIYREAQNSNRMLNGEIEYYTAETTVKHGKLLPPEERTFEIRSSSQSPGEGFGRSPTWYGADPVDDRVWRYVQSFGAKPAKGTKKPPRNNNPELRRKVEKNAVKHAIAHYEGRYGKGCWKTVEEDRVGWDLEIFAPDRSLLVEVKGLMGPDLICELTPNEYEKMMFAKHRPNYIVYIVNNALAERPAVPVASIFEHIKGRIWRTADGRELVIAERTGARLSCG